MNFVRSTRQPERPVWSLERLKHERAIALGFSIDPSTSVTYTSAFQSYLAFCDAHSFPIEPTPDTFSFYAVYMSHFIKPPSVNSYLSGICNQLEPFFPDVRAIRRHPLVSKSLAGCYRLRNTPANRKRAISREEVGNACLSLATSTNHDDMLFIAICVTSFHGLMRLGESVFPDKASMRDYRKVVRRSTVTLDHASYRFTLPLSKSDHLFEGDQVLIHATNTNDNPIPVFLRYLASRDEMFPFHPELWLRSNGLVPTRSWFMRRLRSVFPGNIGGQSFRAGGATALALARVDAPLIQGSGRWSSETFKIYIRRHPALLAALISGNRE